MLLVLIFWRSTALPKIHFKEVTYVPYCPTNKTCETSKAFYSPFRCIHHIALDFDTDSSEGLQQQVMACSRNKTATKFRGQQKCSNPASNPKSPRNPLFPHRGSRVP